MPSFKARAIDEVSLSAVTIAARWSTRIGAGAAPGRRSARLGRPEGLRGENSDRRARRGRIESVQASRQKVRGLLQAHERAWPGGPPRSPACTLCNVGETCEAQEGDFAFRTSNARLASPTSWLVRRAGSRLPRALRLAPIPLRPKISDPGGAGLVHRPGSTRRAFAAALRPLTNDSDGNSTRCRRG